MSEEDRESIYRRKQALARERLSADAAAPASLSVLAS
jgi:hypothetical protein